MTFKDLKRIISSNQQQTQSFDKLQNKPFWIWNIEEHKQEDIRTKGECCFNHIIGLPTKDGLEKPIFDYQELLYYALLSQDICNPLNKMQPKEFDLKVYSILLYPAHRKHRHAKDMLDCILQEYLLLCGGGISYYQYIKFEHNLS